MTGLSAQHTDCKGWLDRIGPYDGDTRRKNEPGAGVFGWHFRDFSLMTASGKCYWARFHWYFSCVG